MKKLAILGASYLQQPLVEKANAMGVETHCFGWDNESAICKDISDFFYPISVLEKELILEKCEMVNINGITTIATDICVPTIAYVSTKMGLTGNSIETAARATNKGEMRTVFSEFNIPSPRFKVVCAGQNSEDLDMWKFPLIVKPTDRSGSLGVQLVKERNEFKQAVQNAFSCSFQKQCVIEEYIEGHEISVESVSWKGEHFILAITDKITTGPPYFVELGHHQPSGISNHACKRVHETVVSVLDALNIKNGAAHTEIKITSKEELFVIECGARMGGDFIGSHLVQLSTGYDFLRAVIEISLDDFTVLHKIKNPKLYAGIYFLSKETEHLMPYFQKKNQFDVKKDMLRSSLQVVRSSNDRSGYLIYESNEKLIL